jgi:hypothetical protein
MTIDSLMPGVQNIITIVSDGSTGNFLATATGTVPCSIAIPSAGIGTASYNIVFTPSGTTTTLSIRNNPGIPVVLSTIALHSRVFIYPGTVIPYLRML